MEFSTRRIFLFTLAFQIASTAQFIGLPKKLTDCSGKECIDYCDLRSVNLVKLLPGEYFDHNCSRIWCNKDFSIFVESCGSYSSNECMLMLSDRRLSYPECCNKICVIFWPLMKTDNYV